MLDEFIELRGDRLFGDDRAISTGFAKMGRHRFLLIGHRKGRETREKLSCNFGCAHPEGYRKALAKMKLAERFGLPIVTLINTPGAYPGIGAEERGQSEAIGRNLYEMAGLRIPIIATVIGEGGSGGALAIAIGDITLMLQYATYSVISPEGCASILWKSADNAAEAVIVEGIVETERDVDTIRKYVPLYEKKYKFKLGEMGENLIALKDPLFCLRPTVVFGFWEKKFSTSATRWVFPRS
jgi:acetyl-CoA carboxylase carboxyl transferase subunit alpha